MKFLLRPALLLAFILLMPGFNFKTKSLTPPRFKHHFIDLTLPIKESGVGDYGLTALTDIDRDGKLDFVLGGRATKPSKLYWYQYQSADHWIRHQVGDDYLSDVGLAAHDVDGDGWVDLVCSGVWYRNTGKPREEGFERIMFDEKASGAHDIVVEDIDGDKKKDIVMMGDSNTQLKGIYWYSIPGNAQETWVRHYIAPGIHGAIAPAGIADVDGDGLKDIVRSDTWFQNPGKGTKWTAHTGIPMGRKGPFGVCVRTAVMGTEKSHSMAICDADIVGSKMAVIGNPDKKGIKWVKQELPQSFEYGSLHALGIADFNGDKLTDIVSAEQEELLPQNRQNPRWMLWLNNGNGKYTENIILDQKLGGHELQVGDVDGDGDIDICSKVWGASRWNGAGGKIHVDFLENLTL